MIEDLILAVEKSNRDFNAERNELDIESFFDSKNYALFDAYLDEDKDINIIAGCETVFLEFQLLNNRDAAEVFELLCNDLHQSPISFAYMFATTSLFYKAIDLALEKYMEGNRIFFGPFLREVSFYDFFEKRITEEGCHIFSYKNKLRKNVITSFEVTGDEYDSDPYSKRALATLHLALQTVENKLFDTPPPKRILSPDISNEMSANTTIQ